MSKLSTPLRANDLDMFEAVSRLQSMQRERAQSIDLGILPQRLRERFEAAQEVAAANAQAALSDIASGAKADLLATLMAMATQKISSTPPSERVRRLWRLANAWSDVVSPHAACKKGCAHCCHIPVTVFAMEAKVIGKAIGVAPTDMSVGVSQRREFGYEHACPFFEKDASGVPGAGSCSIYEHRPLACRLQFNMDDVETLCELHPEITVPVPLMDHSVIDIAAAKALMKDGAADIRDWFPEGRKKTPGKA